LPNAQKGVISLEVTSHLRSQVGIKKGDIDIAPGLRERFFGSENEFSKDAASKYEFK